MVLTTRHCPCGAYVLAVFHNQTLVEVTLIHFTRARCHGQTEPLDPNHYWEPEIPTALADRRAPDADLGRDPIMRWRDPRDPAPPRRREPNETRRRYLARR